MFVGFLTWWYGDGLNTRIKAVGERLARIGDFFSVGLLAATLFAPFRQLSTGRVNGSLDVQLRAFLDNVISRVIGAFVRFGMIVTALITSAGVVIYGIVMVMAWLLLPLLPLFGILAAILWGGQ